MAAEYATAVVNCLATAARAIMTAVMSTKEAAAAGGGIGFRSRSAFWAGFLAVCAGVTLQLPMYLDARGMGYRLAGMPMDTAMYAGMALVLAGLGLTLYAVMPPAGQELAARAHRIRVRALDDAPIGATHVGLLFVMAIAVTIDVINPTNLSFVLPGMTREYGLTSPLNPGGGWPAALLPLSGITGTVIGSFIWGWLGDRIGRRASILMAGIVFVATSACGSMPMYSMNLLMCFIMGLGVGGMLPIIFTMMAETIPARHRGWLMVLVGGDVAGAYIISSSLATLLIPQYSWRILWLIGFPTGILLFLLNRWIPESARYLMANGRQQEAEAVMARYGAVLTAEDADAAATGAEYHVADRWAQLFAHPYRGLSIVIVLLSIGVGLVAFGFQLWIPSNLQKLGMSERSASALLRNAALMGFPLNFGVAALYGLWSSKRTLMLLSGLTAAALVGFLAAGNGVVAHRTLLYALLIMPIWGISSLLAALSSYGAEVYPTRVRSRGAGLVAGFSKIGGVLVIALVAAAVAPPSIAGTALMGAVPLVAATAAVAVFGVETRKRQLEDIRPSSSRQCLPASRPGQRNSDDRRPNLKVRPSVLLTFWPSGHNGGADLQVRPTPAGGRSAAACGPSESARLRRR
jgi:putative MFS transporter